MFAQLTAALLDLRAETLGRDTRAFAVTVDCCSSSCCCCTPFPLCTWSW